MSSLVTSASLWTNDDNLPKKRQPTIRKTIKMRPVLHGGGEPDEYISQAENYQNLEPSTIGEIQTSNDERSSRVNELLNKITSADTSENSKMGNFNPIPPPSINVKKDMPTNQSKNSPSHYSGDEIRGPVYSNYAQSYQPPPKLQQPYYAKMGINTNNPPDDRLMEKMNYMIHLLEQQQNEKTSNITEEFILYTMLGVFIIYVVDSFARSGKYIR